MIDAMNQYFLGQLGWAAVEFSFVVLFGWLVFVVEAGYCKKCGRKRYWRFRRPTPFHRCVRRVCVFCEE